MNEYQEKLKKLMDEYVHFIYKITKSFSKEIGAMLWNEVKNLEKYCKPAK
ncbi:MAG: hypothetical protein V1891_01655 [bacterium]